MVFNLDGLLSGYETVVCLVPEGGSIVKSQFFIENDVPKCIDFHFAVVPDCRLETILPRSLMNFRRRAVSL